MKPILLCDQDGPLADFDRWFYQRCGEHGYEMDSVFEEQKHRFATDHIPNKAHREAAREMVNSTGWFAELPVTEGAVEGINLLAEHFEVWICTKPLEVNPTCRDEKALWIRKHFGPDWEKRLILAPDKSMVAGDILLDDAPHPDWFDRATWKPAIFPTTWNIEGSKWGHIFHWSWGDPVSKLLEYEENDWL